jgi:hypothetical protein
MTRPSDFTWIFLTVQVRKETIRFFREPKYSWILRLWVEFLKLVLKSFYDVRLIWKLNIKKHLKLPKKYILKITLVPGRIWRCLKKISKIVHKLEMGWIFVYIAARPKLLSIFYIFDLVGQLYHQIDFLKLHNVLTETCIRVILEKSFLEVLSIFLVFSL